MTTANKPKTLAPDLDRDSSLTWYRKELCRVTEVRQAAAAEAERAMEETGDLLEKAIGSGLSPDEGAELAQLSRPTTYRQIARARHRRAKTATLATYEALLTEARAELGRPATGVELAARRDIPLEDFLERLSELSNVVGDEFNLFGTAAVKAVSRLLLELEEPEAEIVRMFVLHRMSRRKISRALHLRESTIAGWTTLALLRALVLLRAEDPGVRAARGAKRAKA